VRKPTKPPEALGRAGKAAWRRAQRALADQEDADRLYELVARYANAVDLADRARGEWRKAGRPFSKASGSAVHPLIRAMQDAERDAARYGEALGLTPGRVRHRGPDPTAVITSDIGESPAAKLRRVK
jgi:phage terminase small subunit